MGQAKNASLSIVCSSAAYSYLQTFSIQFCAFLFFSKNPTLQWLNNPLPLASKACTELKKCENGPDEAVKRLNGPVLNWSKIIMKL